MGDIDILEQQMEGSAEFKAAIQILCAAIKRQIVVTGEPIRMESSDIDLMNGLSLLVVLKEGTKQLELRVAQDTSPEQNKAIRIILETKGPL